MSSVIRSNEMNMEIFRQLYHVFFCVSVSELVFLYFISVTETLFKPLLFSTDALHLRARAMRTSFQVNNMSFF